MKQRLLKFAKEMRRKPTDAEAAMWKALRGTRLLEFKFKRQQPIGSYIADFVCFERRVIVEIDGGQHADNAADDQVRTDWLRRRGFTVMRFWNNEVLQQRDDVLESIIRALRESPSPQPLPREGGGA